jgi:hypothetical protein
LPNEGAPYDVNTATEVTMQVEEQLLPTAFAGTVDVDFTFAYMAFLVKRSETSGPFALMEFHTEPGNRDGRTGRKHGFTRVRRKRML